MRVRVTYSDSNGDIKSKIGECTKSDYEDALQDKLNGRGIGANKIYILDLILSPFCLKNIEVISP